MDHIAIMRKSWGLTRKILSDEKKVESRWYTSRRPPWDRIETGDAVYFKDSGKPVTIVSEVGKVLQFSDLTPRKVKEILDLYWKLDGLDKNDVPRFFNLFKDKRYCVLIFLKNSRGVEPFDVDKRGFGSMSAWITVDDVRKIKSARPTSK